MAISDRIKRSIAQFKSLGVDAVLVTLESDIRYLTQYPAHDAWLLVTSRQAFYITDGRYIEEVKKGLSGATPVKFERTIFEQVALCCRKAGVRSLGVDERHMSVHQYKRLKSFCRKAISIKSVDGLIDVQRTVKDAVEIKLIREALSLNLKAYGFIKPFIKPGVKEVDLLHRLEIFIRRHGVGFAFPPIIASGPNSAYPHARVTGRRLRSNEPVLIDLGIDVRGYKSDLTRMFFLGKMPTSFRDVLSAVREAQQEALKWIRPGVAGKVVDAAARACLKKHGLDEHFTHSLGHGVGMDVHEAPRLSHNSDAVLKEGMVCTVEPGVYFTDKYGIRLEEMVLITKKGCEVLSADYDQ